GAAQLGPRAREARAKPTQQRFRLTGHRGWEAPAGRRRVARPARSRSARQATPSGAVPAYWTPGMGSASGSAPRSSARALAKRAQSNSERDAAAYLEAPEAGDADVGGGAEVEHRRRAGAGEGARVDAVRGVEARSRGRAAHAADAAAGVSG